MNVCMYICTYAWAMKAVDICILLMQYFACFLAKFFFSMFKCMYVKMKCVLCCHPHVCNVVFDQIAPTAAPRNVTGIRANPSSILVSWLPPLLIDHNGNLTGFTVLYRIVGSDIVQSVQLFANVSLYKITQLTPSAKYIIQVACINGNGTGPFSSSIELLSGDNSK